MFESIKSIWGKVRDLMFPKQSMEKLADGRTLMSADMIRRITLWNDMQNGEASWCDGSDVISIGIESGIVREFADTCLSEMEGSVSVDDLDKMFQFAIRDLNEELQEGLALGSMIIRPLPNGLVEYIDPMHFIPIRIDRKKDLTDVIFLDIREAKVEGQYYVRAERHTLTNNVLTITNKAYKSQGKTGIQSEIPLDTVDDWADIKDEQSYKGVERPIFGYFKTPVKNKIDGTALGVSVYNKAIELVQDADEHYGRLLWEMLGGELAVNVDPSAIDPKKTKTDSFSKRLYRTLDVELGNGKNLFEVFSPELRDESIIRGLNAILRRIEFAVGLSYGDLSDVQDVMKTATEVLSSKQRKYQTVKALEANLKDCLEDLIYALAFWSGKTLSKYEFSCEFHDSILTNEDEQNNAMREDVAAGIIRPEKYIAKKYGVDEETAAKDWMPGDVVADA